MTGQALKKLRFTWCAQEQTVYKRGKDSDDIIVSVYDDDLIVTREDPHAIAIFKQQMMGEFDMSDLGSLTYYLVIEVEQDGKSIAIKQSTYTTKLLIQFGMMDCYAIKTPMEPMVQLHNDRISPCHRVLPYLLHTSQIFHSLLVCQVDSWRDSLLCIRMQ
jgi:hypothetical protein